MCGIAGIVSPFPVENAAGVMSRMTQALAHRGPDGEAQWMDPDGQTVLGHRRLAIIDISPKGAQPMHYLGRYTIIHNGEIYNYLEVRNDLVDRGYSFHTESDTEVILAAFDCWGRFCGDHFDGMFSFAIWDAQEKRLFAMRDRFGEKPFYYSYDRQQGVLYFASEPKALFAAGIPRLPDESMWLLYLGNGAIGHPSDTGRTYFRNIRQLEPGHLFYFTPGVDPGPVIARYWNPDHHQSAIGEQEAISRFHSAFYESVSRRMRADVNIGTSLSGGIDSSSVLAMIHHQSERHQYYHQQAFTAVFPGFDRDEGARAREVANYFQVDQQETCPDAIDFANHIDQLIRHHEEPVGSASIFAQFKTFQLARDQGVKVVLDGQGADETLGGYERYDAWFLQEMMAASRWSIFRKEKRLLGTHWSWKNTMAAFFPALASRQLGRYRREEAAYRSSLQSEFVRQFLTDDLHDKPVIRHLNDILWYTTSVQGLSELLRYADRNSMYHGVEVRLPFLEYELVSLAFQLPSNYKIREGYHKWILRKAMEGKLPSSITWQKNKIGFEPPQEEWMKQETIVERIHESRRKLVRAGILDAGILDKKIQPHSAYAADTVAWRHLVAGLLF